MLHDIIQTQEEIDISESKNECWTAAKLSKDPNLLFSFSFYFLNYTMLQNSVITKNIYKYIVYSFPRFQKWMKTDSVPNETGNRDESYKKNNTEERTHLRLYEVWPFLWQW